MATAEPLLPRLMCFQNWSCACRTDGARDDGRISRARSAERDQPCIDRIALGRIEQARRDWGGGKTKVFLWSIEAHQAVLLVEGEDKTLHGAGAKIDEGEGGIEEPVG